jgi:hypothetical protein
MDAGVSTELPVSGSIGFAVALLVLGGVLAACGGVMKIQRGRY